MREGVFPVVSGLLVVVAIGTMQQLNVYVTYTETMSPLVISAPTISLTSRELSLTLNVSRKCARSQGRVTIVSDEHVIE